MGVKVGVGSPLIPQRKQLAMGAKGQTAAPASGGGLAATMNGGGGKMKKVASPAKVPSMKGMGTKGMGKIK